MGAYISCASKTLPSGTGKVIHWNGSVQHLPRRIKAAELMLDNPQHFVCHANGLQIRRRINPLTADEELEMGHFYFLLPMSKLHSVLSGTDMAALGLKANSAMNVTRRRSSRARVLPLFGELIRPLSPEMKSDVLLLEEGKQSGRVQEEQLPVLKSFSTASKGLCIAKILDNSKVRAKFASVDSPSTGLDVVTWNLEI